jgi:hypothetical protein
MLRRARHQLRQCARRGAYPPALGSPRRLSSAPGVGSRSPDVGARETRRRAARAWRGAIPAILVQQARELGADQLEWLGVALGAGEDQCPLQGGEDQ